MPIDKGITNASKIYRGTKQILKAYVGNKLVYTFGGKAIGYYKTLSNPLTPGGDINDYFGDIVDLYGTDLLVGVPYTSYAIDDTAVGAVYLFDLVTGTLLYIFLLPGERTLDYGYFFGTSVSQNASYVLIAKADYDTVDAVHLFSKATGALVANLVNPNTSLNMNFGVYYVKALTNYAVVLSDSNTGGADLHYFNFNGTLSHTVHLVNGTGVDMMVTNSQIYANRTLYPGELPLQIPLDYNPIDDVEAIAYWKRIANMMIGAAAYPMRQLAWNGTEYTYPDDPDTEIAYYTEIRTDGFPGDFFYYNQPEAVAKGATGYLTGKSIAEQYMFDDEMKVWIKTKMNTTAAQEWYTIYGSVDSVTVSNKTVTIIFNKREGGTYYDFAIAKYYKPGDLVYYDGTHYQFNVTHYNTAWNPTHVDVVSNQGYFSSQFDTYYDPPLYLARAGYDANHYIKQTLPVLNRKWFLFDCKYFPPPDKYPEQLMRDFTLGTIVSMGSEIVFHGRIEEYGFPYYSVPGDPTDIVLGSGGWRKIGSSRRYSYVAKHYFTPQGVFLRSELDPAQQTGADNIAPPASTWLQETVAGYNVEDNGNGLDVYDGTTFLHSLITPAIPYGNTFNENYGWATDVYENLIAVATPHKHSINALNTGYVEVRNILTNETLFTFTDPNPRIENSVNINDYGYSVAIYGTRLYVGCPGFLFNDPAQDRLGFVYEYDLTTGNLVYTWESVDHHGYGYRLEIIDEFIVIASSGSYNEVSRVDVYNRFSRAHQYTAYNPTPDVGATDYFGYTIAVSDNYLLVGDYYNGVVLVHDLVLRSYVGTLTNPDDNSSTFGRTLAIQGNRFIVGSSEVPYTDVYWWGAVYIYTYDEVNGIVLERTIETPYRGPDWDEVGHDYFGDQVVSIGNYLAVAYQPDWDDNGEYDVEIAIINIFTGVTVETIRIFEDGYTPDSGDYLSVTLKSKNNYLIVGTPGQGDSRGEFAGKVHIYKKW